MRAKAVPSATRRRTVTRMPYYTNKNSFHEPRLVQPQPPSLPPPSGNVPPFVFGELKHRYHQQQQQQLQHQQQQYQQQQQFQATREKNPFQKFMSLLSPKQWFSDEMKETEPIELSLLSSSSTIRPIPIVFERPLHPPMLQPPANFPQSTFSNRKQLLNRVTMKILHREEQRKKKLKRNNFGGSGLLQKRFLYQRSKTTPTTVIATTTTVFAPRREVQGFNPNRIVPEDGFVPIVRRTGSVPDLAFNVHDDLKENKNYSPYFYGNTGTPSASSKIDEDNDDYYEEIVDSVQQVHDVAVNKMVYDTKHVNPQVNRGRVVVDVPSPVVPYAPPRPKKNKTSSSSIAPEADFNSFEDFEKKQEKRRLLIEAYQEMDRIDNPDQPLLFSEDDFYDYYYDQLSDQQTSFGDYPSPKSLDYFIESPHPSFRRQA